MILLTTALTVVNVAVLIGFIIAVKIMLKTNIEVEKLIRKAKGEKE